jgi:hypothetical protein
MIISHLHRFIFFAVPKTGTHAVRQALRQHLGEADLEQVGLFVQKRFPYPQLSDIRHGHINVQQIRPVLGDDVFEAYYKFAFVRNPYDRFVSYCAFMSRKTGAFESDPRAFMRHVLTEVQPFDHLLFRPQHEFLTEADGRIAMNFVGRNEAMQRDYDAITKQLAVPTTGLSRVNASSHRPWRDYYDVELADRVASIYRRDFELFGYAEDPDADQSE